MEKRTIPAARWEAIEAWFDAVMRRQADEAVELAGWIPPGFDPNGAYRAVAIDRAYHLAVYVRHDGTRETKPVPEFLDDPFTPPTDTRPKPPPVMVRAPTIPLLWAVN